MLADITMQRPASPVPRVTVGVGDPAPVRLQRRAELSATKELNYQTLSVALVAALGLCACTGPQGPSGVQGPTGQTGRTSVDQVIVTPARAGTTETVIMAPARPLTRTTETVTSAPGRATRMTTVSRDSTYYTR